MGQTLSDTTDDLDWFDFDEYYEGADVSCKYCGERGLMWFQQRDGWRLFDEHGELHSCRRAKVDFPLVPPT